MKASIVIIVLLVTLPPALWIIGRWIGVRLAQQLIDQNEGRQNTADARNKKAGERAVEEHLAKEREAQQKDIELQNMAKKPCNGECVGIVGPDGVKLPDFVHISPCDGNHGPGKATHGHASPRRARPVPDERHKIRKVRRSSSPRVDLTLKPTDSEGENEPKMGRKESKGKKPHRSRRRSPGQMV